MLKIYQGTINEIDQELIRVGEKFPGSFNSRHEGFAVLKGEVDELWDKIKQDAPAKELYDEVKQVAAMAIKFMQECCREEK